MKVAVVKEIAPGERRVALVPEMVGRLRSLPMTFVGALAVGLLLWRVWTFTLLPLLRPDDPKEVPYWIPGRCELLRHVRAEC